MALVLGLFHQSGLVPAMELIQQQALGFQECHDVHSNTYSDNDHTVCFTDDNIRGMLCKTNENNASGSFFAVPQALISNILPYRNGQKKIK